MVIFDIYTDGSIAHNPGGRGGWAFVVYHKNKLKFFDYGTEEKSTNNRAEFLALTRCLELFKAEGCSPKCQLNIYSDSRLVVNLYNGKFKTVKNNEDLIERIKIARQGLNVNVEWVKGHSTSVGNNLADFYANRAALNNMTCYPVTGDIK
ncbi:MAG: ribonuclease HI [Thermodesulfobacteriota bacterium]